MNDFNCYEKRSKFFIYYRSDVFVWQKGTTVLEIASRSGVFTNVAREYLSARSAMPEHLEFQSIVSLLTSNCRSMSSLSFQIVRLRVTRG